ncbi:UNKNOWN [Stylonychia lemnae]|uniref:Transmembrane protein n=1 Tax=Stylonychia lemnae TaxID=5949 RepID=A0A078AM90_STYLE|nr:UNKNOWN [Stylonychia lemnae]|eukprot:CDW82502.1 UNKNOWN [Stylonychia lemnae]
MKIFFERLINTAMFLQTLLMITLSNLAQACNYYSLSIYQYNDNLCNGQYCTSDFQCENYTCTFGVCNIISETTIYRIVFISAFIVTALIILTIFYCKKKRRARALALAIRNQQLHHDHSNQHNYQGQPEVQRLVGYHSIQQADGRALSQQQLNSTYDQPGGFQMQSNYDIQHPIIGKSDYATPQSNVHQQQKQLQPQIQK